MIATNNNAPAKTRTGGFPIGFRRGWSEWQHDLNALCAWAKTNNFACVDLGNDADKALPTLKSYGLETGSVDLGQWKELISADKAKREDAVAKQSAYIQECAKHGAHNLFCVMLPDNPALSRKENFGYMCESYAALAPALEAANSKIVIEGWPGPGALCCTPETLRAFFKEVPSMAMGVNYDPSHLIRMGIDPIRFLGEFVSRVAHVHGKDCEIFAERIQDLGWEQEPTFAEGLPFGGHFWRYTIPGHGIMRWPVAFSLLENAGYKGAVCIELEDGRFNGTEGGEKGGLVLSKIFLMGC